jgi:hypothetical protein
MLETDANGLHRVELSIAGVLPNTLHTLSLFVKSESRAAMMLEMRDSVQGKYGTARFDLRAKKTLDQSSNIVRSGVKSVGNGWVRIWATMPYASDAAVVNFTIMDAFAHSYQGDGRSGLLVWGLQFEPSGDVNSYVATTTEPKPRQ